VYDTDTNLNYLNARYYNSSDGKFISQDPVYWELGITKDGKAVLTNPQSLNSYSYANNNPITLKDPSGRVVPIVIAAGLGAAGAYAYYDYKTNTQPTLNDANSGSFDKALAIGMFAVDLTPMGVEGAASKMAGKEVAANIAGKYGADAIRIAKELKEGVKSEKLINIINSFYKSTDDLPFGTAGAAAKEILNEGLKVGGKSHVYKAETFVNGLNKIINNTKSTTRDSEVAKTLLDKLNAALNIKK